MDQRCTADSKVLAHNLDNLDHKVDWQCIVVSDTLQHNLDMLVMIMD